MGFMIVTAFVLSIFNAAYIIYSYWKVNKYLKSSPAVIRTSLADLKKVLKVVTNDDLSATEKEKKTFQ